MRESDIYRVTDPVAPYTNDEVLDKLVQNILRNRRLGTKHFDTAAEHLQSLIDKSVQTVESIKIDDVDTNPYIPLKDHTLSLVLTNMVATKAAPIEYRPAMKWIRISQDSFITHDRLLPVRLYAPHLEFRHIQRSAKVLSYKQDPFRFVLIFSLLLSKVLENQISSDSIEDAPIVVPQLDGMFLGTAKRVTPDSYDFSNMLCATCRPNKPEGALYKSKAEWLPVVEITLKTYIHSRDFFGAQRHLHQKLSPFFEDQYVAPLNRLAGSYLQKTKSSSWKSQEKMEVDDLVQMLARIIQGSEWNLAVRKANAKHNTFDIR